MSRNLRTKNRLKNSLAASALALCLLVAACTAPSPLVYSQLDREATQGDRVTVVDKRSLDERKSEFLSLVVTNEKYGIYRIGDGEIQPDRIAYIEARLRQKAESRLAGKTVEVLQAVILNNQQALMRRSAASSAIGGSIGAVVVDAMDKSGPFIDIAIRLQIAGATYTSRHTVEYINTGQSPSTNANLAASIKKGLDSTVDDIASRI